MRKLFRLQDYLLLGLAGGLDCFFDLRDPFGFYNDTYKNVCGFVPDRFKKTNFYQTVNHSLKTGYLEKIIKDGKPYLRLTSSGQKKIQREFSFLRFQKQKWDGKWRIVIFDIEEKEKKTRNLLRLKLRELGFGLLQESVWISPYDVILDFREFIKSLKLEENVYAMEVTNLLAGDKKELASKIWKLENINKAYQALFDSLTKLCDRIKISNNKNDKDELVGLQERYLDILKEDPCLPKELLPEGWMGEKVREKIKQAMI